FPFSFSLFHFFLSFPPGNAWHRALINRMLISRERGGTLIRFRPARCYIKGPRGPRHPAVGVRRRRERERRRAERGGAAPRSRRAGAPAAVRAPAMPRGNALSQPSTSRAALEVQLPKKRGRPSLSDLILRAVCVSTARKGASLALIKKTLATEGYDVVRNGGRLKAALGALVTKGLLQRVTGTGIAGSFRIGPQQRGCSRGVQGGRRRPRSLQRAPGERRRLRRRLLHRRSPETSGRRSRERAAAQPRAGFSIRSVPPLCAGRTCRAQFSIRSAAAAGPNSFPPPPPSGPLHNNREGEKNQ
uniref:H15 domain-containing protein n=1 Tax=Anser cygnoides TaxID=8845 RepID=A0A8B9EDS9_ANSCY